MACKIRIRVKKKKYIRGDNTTMKYTSIIIPFVGGLGMFIYGMQIMAQGLENAAGNRMKSLLEALTKNKFFGVLLGAFITAVIQSSSATTVMVVGFVNAGIMKLGQAIPVVFGANVGSTATAQILRLGDLGEDRYNSYRMAGIQCGMGQIFKSVQSGTGCDHDRCDHYADRKEAFDKRYRKYCGWFRTFICRDFIHVLSGGTTER